MTKKQKIVYLYFILLPFIDVITSLIVRFTDSKISIGSIVKGFTLLFGIIYTIFFSKSKLRKISIKYLLIITLFILLYIFTKYEIFSLFFFYNEINNIMHYFYFPLMIVGIFNYFDDIQIPNKHIEKVLFINSICYSLLLLIPYAIGTSFNSYRWDNFFGNNGWFFSANEIGAITVILLSSTLYFLNYHNKKIILIVIPILLSIILVGTKVSFLGMIIVVLLISIFYIIKEKEKNYFIPIFLIISLFILCTISPTINNFNSSIDNLNLPEDTNIENSKENNLITLKDLTDNKIIIDTCRLIFNEREDFFANNFYVYSKSGVTNILFGIGWTNWSKYNYDYERKLIEIDYLDIIIHYGVLGFIVYFAPAIYLLFNILKNKTKKGYYVWYNLIIFILGILISSIAGHVLSAPAVSIYLVLILYLIYNYKKGSYKNEKNSNIR